MGDRWQGQKLFEVNVTLDKLNLSNANRDLIVTNKKRNVYKISVENLTERHHLEDLWIHERLTLEARWSSLH
jgi:hypothetical protein